MACSGHDPVHHKTVLCLFGYIFSQELTGQKNDEKK